MKKTLSIALLSTLTLVGCSSSKYFQSSKEPKPLPFFEQVSRSPSSIVPTAIFRGAVGDVLSQGVGKNYDIFAKDLISTIKANKTAFALPASHSMAGVTNIAQLPSNAQREIYAKIANGDLWNHGKMKSKWKGTKGVRSGINAALKQVGDENPYLAIIANGSDINLKTMDKTAKQSFAKRHAGKASQGGAHGMVIYGNYVDGDLIKGVNLKNFEFTPPTPKQAKNAEETINSTLNAVFDRPLDEQLVATNMLVDDMALRTVSKGKAKTVGTKVCHNVGKESLVTIDEVIIDEVQAVIKGEVDLAADGVNKKLFRQGLYNRVYKKLVDDGQISEAFAWRRVDEAVDNLGVDGVAPCKNTLAI